MEINIFLNAFIERFNTSKKAAFSDFTDLYKNRIKKSSYELMKEISENLLSLPLYDRKHYLEYVEERLNNETGYKSDSSVLNKWILEFDLKESEFPYTEHLELVEILKTSIEFSDLDPNEATKVENIQMDFCTYAYHLEVLKVIEFIVHQYHSLIINEGKIKWIGKPSQLGFIIGKLIEFGYVESPTKTNGETNYTQLAKLVYNTFDVETTEATLSKYLNLESEKAQETVRQFEKNKFYIPQIKEVS
jgi:hypothetical protein